MVTIAPIFSGSSGNCTLVTVDKQHFLVDVGLGYKTTVSALKAYNVSPTDIDAIFITHEHSDHVGGLAQWQKHHATPVYAPSTICQTVCEKGCCCCVQPCGSGVDLGTAHVQVYQCSHDSAACVGYRFDDGNQFVATVTDTGFGGKELVEFLRPCVTVQLESNHDVDMLQNGPYPYLLKQRILSDCGHLSNVQAANVLEQLVDSNVKNVILAHLSEHNNTAELAFNTVVEMYARHNLVEGRDVNVYVAKQRGNLLCV